MIYKTLAFGASVSFLAALNTPAAGQPLKGFGGVTLKIRFSYLTPLALIEEGGYGREA